MSLCSLCQSERRSSRIPKDVLVHCPKNRSETCHACQKLSQIDSKIAETRKSLDRLLEEREALATVLNEQHDPFAHRLPVEVVSRILIHCRPFASVVKSRPSYDRKMHVQGIFKLTHICHRWRNIAHSIPDLWTIIPCHVTKNNCLYLGALLDKWLGRTGHLPLSIIVRLKGPKNLEDHVLSGSLRKIVGKIVQVAERWKVLDLELPCPALLWILADLSMIPLDLLQHIRLLSKDVDEHLEATVILKAAPTHMCFNVDFRRISVEWAKLTHFESRGFDEYFSVSKCAELFRNAPHLTTCKLEFIDSREDDSTSTPPPVLGVALETLELERIPPEFWDFFTFPALKTLKFVINDEDGGWDRLNSFLVRSNCQLQHLDLWHQYATEEDVIETLWHTPALRTLSIQGPDTEDFFTLMDAAASATGSLTPSDFLCHLEEISFTTCFLEKWSWPVLFTNTMKTRANPTLGAVELIYLNHFSDKTLYTTIRKDELEYMIAASQGIEFRLYNGSGGDMLKKLCQHHGVKHASTSL